MQEQIDHETGEILTTTSIYQSFSQDGGKYGMFSRETCWYDDLNAVSEFKVLLQLLNVENQNTGVINIDKKLKLNYAQTKNRRS